MSRDGGCEGRGIVDTWDGRFSWENKDWSRRIPIPHIIFIT